MTSRITTTPADALRAERLLAECRELEARARGDHPAADRHRADRHRLAALLAGPGPIDRTGPDPS